MKISVITAVYNGVETIADAIESVLAQSYPHVELIVIDGASTDGTLAILEQYRDRIAVLVSELDDGIYDALNKGIKHATGDVVGFLHADDLYEGRDVLSDLAKVFADPSIDAVYGDLVYVSKNRPDNIIRYWRSGKYSPERLKAGWMPPHPTFYVRRSVYEEMGGFDTSFHIAADYDCMLRFLGMGKINCHYIPEVLVRMRVGGESNRSIKNIFRKSLEDYQALKRNKIGGIGALLWKNFSKLPQFFLRNK